MIDVETWRMGWRLLSAREKRNAWFVLAIVTAAALSSAAMVGSVVPFLSVLSNPDLIRSVELLSWAYDYGGFTSDYSFLVWLGLGSLAVICLSNLLQVMRTWAVARYAYMRIYSLSHRLLAAYMGRPYEYFLDNNSSDMSSQILQETHEVVYKFFQPAADAIAALLTVIAVVCVLFSVNFTVAIVAFGVLGGIYGGTFLLSRRLIRSAGNIRAKANKDRFRFAGEALAGFKVIKLLGREKAYIDRYSAPTHRMAQAIVLVQIMGLLPQYVMQAVGFGGIIILCLVMIDPDLLASGTALGETLPLLGLFAFAGQRLLPELSRLYQALTSLNASNAAVSAVYRDMFQDMKASEILYQPKSLGLAQELRLEDVCYSYPSATQAGIFNVSLTIKAGERIGIVGTTGSGKTTLADVILGLLKPQAGHLHADGTDISNDNLRHWQRTVGYVPQEIFLTDASIAENIALGYSSEEIDRERLYSVAKMTRLDKLIEEQLANGYETLVGDRGVRLSGGQRQRIGIARALYVDADLIVFDEATSALDNLTEVEVMNAINALPGDKTIMMIAHRLSTVQACDRIIVMANGRVVGFDTWDALMADNPIFQNIAKAAHHSNKEEQLA